MAAPEDEVGVGLFADPLVVAAAGVGSGVHCWRDELLGMGKGKGER